MIRQGQKLLESEVAHVEDKMREYCLRRFTHVVTVTSAQLFFRSSLSRDLYTSENLENLKLSSIGRKWIQSSH